jgi:hypothetical protein
LIVDLEVPCSSQGGGTIVFKHFRDFCGHLAEPVGATFCVTFSVVFPSIFGTAEQGVVYANPKYIPAHC